MTMKRILRCLLFTIAAITVSLPAQAGMVGTAQMQAGPGAIDAGNVDSDRVHAGPDEHRDLRVWGAVLGPKGAFAGRLA